MKILIFLLTIAVGGASFACDEHANETPTTPAQAGVGYDYASQGDDYDFEGSDYASQGDDYDFEGSDYYNHGEVK